MANSEKPTGMVTIDLKLVGIIAALVGVPTVGTHLVSTADLDEVTTQLEEVQDEQKVQAEAQTATANKVAEIATDVGIIKAKWEENGDEVEELTNLLKEDLKKRKRR